MTLDVKSSRMVALIPARGGSKGIPRKNLAEVNGRPLISYSIEAALGSGRFSAVIVSSDDQEILDFAANAGAIPVVRSAELATDQAAMLPVMQHAVRSCLADPVASTVSDDGVLVLLQPTSPLRTSRHIASAMDAFELAGARALVSVVREDAKCLKNFFMDSTGELRGIVNDSFPFMQRQELPPVFRPNGAIYIYLFSDILRGHLLPRQTVGFEMDSEVSVDVDSVEDIKIVESLLGARARD